MQNIDIYVDVIDNFWDMWFAFDIAKNLIKNDENRFIRFFWNDKELFLKLSWNKDILNIKYFDLTEINALKPSEIILNFFDRKIDYDFLNKFEFNINLIIFWYFWIHNWIQSLHNTFYEQKNVSVTHFIPSVLENTGWIILQDFWKNITKKSFFPWKNDDFYQKNWISVFVYPETFEIIKDLILKDKENLYFIFDDRNKLSWENIIQMPFLEIDEYYNFLKVCQKNIVRGENSFIKAILAWKPYLWDIYNEPNNQHIYKIDEFWDFLWDDNYKEILKIFNLKDKKSWLEKFLSFENNDFFENKSKYILKNCDLMKNLEKLIQKK